MNRERTAKLLKHTGLAVLKRPDGGVVTQRTAKPARMADFRQTWHFHLAEQPAAARERPRQSANIAPAYFPLAGGPMAR